MIGEQSLIMESLCSEHLLGRWIWKSGRAKGDKHAVPWNVQNINTNPENFVWEKDRTAITTVAPGLYEVTFGARCDRTAACAGWACIVCVPPTRRRVMLAQAFLLARSRRCSCW